ncbi:hypothetical protein RclHR1_13300001 [Rhizophagus clarus]|uniref:DUF659 domain-containing protein n=1 Tax=Rhizophagus clarus TaxID=94130 RepID=A0A2Z6QE85_9GLOM|nr:hypothetical protein RclHR1_13300001 [Rhizophagus clarus]
MLIELGELKISLLAVVTDSTPAYNAARKRLQTQYRNIVFLSCYAYQINLYIGKIFKVSSEFKTISQQALKLAVYFKNANNKYFIDNIELEQHTNLLDNLEEDKETEPDDNNRSNVNCETEESDDDINDEEFNIEEEFQNQIDRFLEIDGNIDDDVNDIDVEGVGC